MTMLEKATEEKHSSTPEATRQTPTPQLHSQTPKSGGTNRAHPREVKTTKSPVRTYEVSTYF